MKVATLNYHNAYNYGAVFQAAALRHIIETLGAECDIIDYRNAAVERQYAFRGLQFGGGLRRAIRANLVLLPFIRKKRRNFRPWFAAYQKTPQVDRTQLPALAERYDRIIVGSDQVWNMKCHDADLSYLLDFVKESDKKIAYAASFGAYDIAPEYETAFQKYLPEFSHISVREERGAALVERFSGDTPLCVIDPVLLVGRGYWEGRMQRLPERKPYIFVYHLGHGRDVSDVARKLKRSRKLPVVFVTGHSGNMVHYAVTDRNRSTASPEEFLSLLANAAFVVTNSFHATALSLLFHKDFCAVVRGDDKAAYNSRIYHLLNLFGLTDRICRDFSEEQFGGAVDYTGFDAVLAEEQKKSTEFLKYAIFS